MGVRDVFLRRVRDILFDRLSREYLKGWDVQQRLKFTEEVVAENKAKIEDYLNGTEVHLSNINQVADYIVENILIPSIKI